MYCSLQNWLHNFLWFCMGLFRAVLISYINKWSNDYLSCKSGRLYKELSPNSAVPYNMTELSSSFTSLILYINLRPNQRYGCWFWVWNHSVLVYFSTFQLTVLVLWSTTFLFWFTITILINLVSTYSEVAKFSLKSLKSANADSSFINNLSQILWNYEISVKGMKLVLLL